MTMRFLQTSGEGQTVTQVGVFRPQRRASCK